MLMKILTINCQQCIASMFLSVSFYLAFVNFQEDRVYRDFYLKMFYSKYIKKYEVQIFCFLISILVSIDEERKNGLDN